MASKTIQQLLHECTVSGYKPEKKTKGTGFIHELARVEKVAQNKEKRKKELENNPEELDRILKEKYDLKGE